MLRRTVRIGRSLQTVRAMVSSDRRSCSSLFLRQVGAGHSCTRSRRTGDRWCNQHVACFGSKPANPVKAEHAARMQALLDDFRSTPVDDQEKREIVDERSHSSHEQQIPEKTSHDCCSGGACEAEHQTPGSGQAKAMSKAAGGLDAEAEDGGGVRESRAPPQDSRSKDTDRKPDLREQIPTGGRLVNNFNEEVAATSKKGDCELLNYERDMSLILLWKESLKISELKEEDLIVLQQRFPHFKLVPPEIMERFEVKVSKDLKSMIFPLYGSSKKEPTGAKVVAVNADGTFSTALVQRDDGLFGYNLVDKSANLLAVFASELDAMVCYCRTDYFAVSVPEQLELKTSKVLPELRKYERLFFWFPAEEMERAKSIGRMAGASRSYFVRDYDTRSLTLSELVSRRQRAYTNIEKILLNAERMLHSSICSVKSEADLVASFVYKYGVLAGIAQWKRLSLLNRYLGGLRLGELTLLSGPTGCGKTTFLSLYSLDLCEQLEAKVNTLWCSFEITNCRLMQIMMQQLSGRRIDDRTSHEEFSKCYEKLSRLPLYFSTFCSTDSLDTILSAISHHVKMFDIKHVVIDNLQFITGQHCSANVDPLRLQDRVFMALRQLASDYNVHVTIVTHPRKEIYENVLTVNSLYGGVRASQEADNIIMMQTKRSMNEPNASPRLRRFLQVLKNRRVGELEVGNRLELIFNPVCTSYSLIKHDYVSNVTEVAQNLQGELRKPPFRPRAEPLPREDAAFDDVNAAPGDVHSQAEQPDDVGYSQIGRPAATRPWSSSYASSRGDYYAPRVWSSPSSDQYIYREGSQFRKPWYRGEAGRSQWVSGSRWARSGPDYQNRLSTSLEKGTFERRSSPVSSSVQSPEYSSFRDDKPKY